MNTKFYIPCIWRSLKGTRQSWSLWFLYHLQVTVMVSWCTYVPRVITSTWPTLGVDDTTWAPWACSSEYPLVSYEWFHTSDIGYVCMIMNILYKSKSAHIYIHIYVHIYVYIHYIYNVYIHMVISCYIPMISHCRCTSPSTNLALRHDPHPCASNGDSSRLSSHPDAPRSGGDGMLATH